LHPLLFSKVNTVQGEFIQPTTHRHIVGVPSVDGAFWRFLSNTQFRPAATAICENGSHCDSMALDIFALVGVRHFNFPDKMRVIPLADVEEPLGAN